MTMPVEKYEFTADINRYVSATCLEELTTCLQVLASATDYDGAMSALTSLSEYAEWHKSNIADDFGQGKYDGERCHKESTMYAKMTGEY